MKANAPKRKIFNDAVDLLGGADVAPALEDGVQMLPIDSIRPFRKHPFRLYEGSRHPDGPLPLVAAVDLSYLSSEEQERVSGLAEQGKIKLDAKTAKYNRIFIKCISRFVIELNVVIFVVII